MSERSERFDNLAKAVAEPHPIGRRKLLGRALAAVGIGAGASVLGAEAAGAAKPGGGTNCPPGLTACGTVCRDVTSSNDNCGACGHSCANDSVCRNGVCVPVTCTCSPTCPAGQSWCSGACVDTSSNSNNCGACGHVCPSGTTCSNGQCSGVCSPGSTQGCGTCGVGVCQRSGTQTCGTDGTWGACTCNPGAPQPFNCANGLDNDCDGNIDTCPSGTVCKSDGTCGPSSGGCTSAADCPPSTECQTAVCQNGTCGVVNKPAGTACSAGTCDGTGVCVSNCPSGTTDCGGVCRNLNTDSSNCGSCGHVCSAPNATMACSGGQCVIVTCASGFADCNANASDGCEVNIATDFKNCGSCGHACASGQVCSNGTCV